MAPATGRGTFAGLLGGGGRFGRGSILSFDIKGSNSATFSCLSSFSVLIDSTGISSTFLTCIAGKGCAGFVAGFGGGGLLGWAGRLGISFFTLDSKKKEFKPICSLF